MEFKASSSRSGLIGLAVAGGLAAGAIGIGVALLSKEGVPPSQSPPPLTLGLGVALLLDLAMLTLLLYWSIAALRLRYRLDRNGLVVYWGASRLVVPMERIQAVTPGSQVGAAEDSSHGYRAFRGVAWAGLRAGRARLTNDQPARVYTTAPFAQSIIVFTPDQAYVVSPPDPSIFIEAWRVRRPLGPTQHWREEEQWAWPLNLPVWHDRLAWALVALGLLTNLALYSYLTFIYNRLPAVLPFHFDVLGQADRVAGRSEILRLPQIALLMLIVDLVLGFVVYRHERVAAYLIWGGGLALQLLVVGAVFTIIR